MRKILILICMATMTGCAWLGFGDNSETVAANEPAAAETAAPEAAAETPKAPEEKAAPAKKTSKKAVKTQKGKKSESQIKTELDAMGKKLAAQSARTLLPNKSKPEYKQAGSEWIANYIDVDTNHVTTELRPGANGQYIGFIRYQERFMECRGASKQAALKGDCRVVKTRNLNELIRYDGKAWQD